MDKFLKFINQFKVKKESTCTHSIRDVETREEINIKLRSNKKIKEMFQWYNNCVDKFIIYEKITQKIQKDLKPFTIEIVCEENDIVNYVEEVVTQLKNNFSNIENVYILDYGDCYIMILPDLIVTPYTYDKILEQIEIERVVQTYTSDYWEIPNSYEEILIFSENELKPYFNSVSFLLKNFSFYGGFKKVESKARNKDCSGDSKVENKEYQKNKNIIKASDIKKNTKNGRIYITLSPFLDAMKMGYTSSHFRCRDRYSTSYGTKVNIFIFENPSRKITLKVERKLHKKLKKYNIGGELYNLDYMEEILDILIKSNIGILTEYNKKIFNSRIDSYISAIKIIRKKSLIKNIAKDYLKKCKINSTFIKRLNCNIRYKKSKLKIINKIGYKNFIKFLIPRNIGKQIKYLEKLKNSKEKIPKKSIENQKKESVKEFIRLYLKYDESISTRKCVRKGEIYPLYKKFKYEAKYKTKKKFLNIFCSLVEIRRSDGCKVKGYTIREECYKNNRDIIMDFIEKYLVRDESLAKKNSIKTTQVWNLWLKWNFRDNTKKNDFYKKISNYLGNRIKTNGYHVFWKWKELDTFII